MRPIPLLLILSALALPALSQAAVRVEVLQTGWPIRGAGVSPRRSGHVDYPARRRAQALAAGKGLSAPISGVPQVWANGQGGLLDVALAPDFAQSRRVWLSYAESDASGKAGTAVGYGRLSEDATQLSNFTVVFRQQPKLSVGNHFGGRLVFDGKGYLFIGLERTISVPPPRISASCRGKWSA
jgi:glucose/arabinose dehydrogenase